MPSKLEQCCDFVNSFKQITWTRVVLVICMIPFALILMILIILFMLATERQGAVVTNSYVCSSIGRDVMKEGGSAVDAAIAAMLCEGVSLPNGAGIGGGFSAVMYIFGKFDSIVATPTVPLAVRNMTHIDERHARGAKSIGVPGELLGYWEMHQRYGVLSWKRLFEPTIQLCENGVPITQWLAGLISHNKERIAQSKTLGAIFEFGNLDNAIAQQELKFAKLAETLRRIADEGVKPFYEGDLGDDFIADIQADQGIMTKKDLENYKVIWDEKPPSIYLKNKFKLVTTPLPTSGAIIIFILNVVKNLKIENGPLFWHKTVEAMKHAFGHSVHLGDALNDPKYRETILKAYHQLIDVDFARNVRNERIKEDRVFTDPLYYGGNYAPSTTEGSANICVLSPTGDAIVATTSILSEFGSFFASTSTGIIANNLLTQFVQGSMTKVISSPTNRPLPGKHIITPNSPTIVISRLTARPYFIVGSSGGIRGITLVASALIRYVLNASSAFEIVQTKDSLHNQLYPNRVEYGEDANEQVLRYLEKVGHEVVHSEVTFDNFSAITCIGSRFDTPEAIFNEQVGGSVALAHAKSDLNILLVFLFGGLAASVVGLMLYEVLNPASFIVNILRGDVQQTEV